MSDPTCPRCGEPADGAFCSECGARTEPAPCPSCGREATPGDRFCTHCGESLAGASGGSGPAGASGAPGASGAAGASGASGPAASGGGSGGPSLGWAAAGAVLIIAIAALALPRMGGGPDDGAGAGADATDAAGETGEGLGPTSSVDLSSMTPREAADRLFDRVIRAWETGERAEAGRFQPMAVGAYERARPLDPDGQFHLAMLHLVAGDWDAVLEEARAGLELEPTHLLNLAIAAEALAAQGDTAAARRHHERFLEHYDEGVASDRADYRAHRELLEGMRRSALDATGGTSDG